MRKLKVIQILPTLNTGGVERGVLDFNNYLVKNGHDSYVISDGGRQVKNLIEDGGNHIHLQISNKSFFTLLQAKKLADVINEISPDIVHIRSRIPAWVLQLSKVFIKNPRPIIFSTFHGLYSTPFYSRIMASFDRVIAISKTVESYVNENYERYLKKPPRLIYRGSDQDYFSQNFAPSDNYLNNFTVHIETPKQKKVKVRSLFNKKLILAVSSVAATLALLLTLTFNKKPVTFNSIENDTLSNYILDETTANDLALLLEDDTYQEADFLSLDNEILDTIVNDLDLEDLIQN